MPSLCQVSTGRDDVPALADVGTVSDTRLVILVVAIGRRSGLEPRVLKPESFLSRRKLTTPATASAPYAADAPPVTASSCEQAFGDDSHVDRAEFVARPEAAAIAKHQHPRCVESPEVEVGPARVRRRRRPLVGSPSCCRTPATGSATRSACSATYCCSSTPLTDVTGVGVFTPEVMRRVPVTVTSSTSCWLCVDCARPPAAPLSRRGRPRIALVRARHSSRSNSFSS